MDMELSDGVTSNKTDYHQAAGYSLLKIEMGIRDRIASIKSQIDKDEGELSRVSALLENITEKYKETLLRCGKIKQQIFEVKVDVEHQNEFIKYLNEKKIVQTSRNHALDKRLSKIKHNHIAAVEAFAKACALARKRASFFLESNKTSNCNTSTIRSDYGIVNIQSNVIQPSTNMLQNSSEALINKQGPILSHSRGNKRKISSSIVGKESSHSNDWATAADLFDSSIRMNTPIDTSLSTNISNHNINDKSENNVNKRKLQATSEISACQAQQNSKYTSKVKGNQKLARGQCQDSAGSTFTTDMAVKPVPKTSNQSQISKRIRSKPLKAGRKNATPKNNSVKRTSDNKQQQSEAAKVVKSKQRGSQMLSSNKQAKLGLVVLEPVLASNHKGCGISPMASNGSNINDHVQKKNTALDSKDSSSQSVTAARSKYCTTAKEVALRAHRDIQSKDSKIGIVNNDAIRTMPNYRESNLCDEGATSNIINKNDRYEAIVNDAATIISEKKSSDTRINNCIIEDDLFSGFDLVAAFQNAQR